MTVLACKRDPRGARTTATVCPAPAIRTADARRVAGALGLADLLERSGRRGHVRPAHARDSRMIGARELAAMSGTPTSSMSGAGIRGRGGAWPPRSQPDAWRRGGGRVRPGAARAGHPALCLDNVLPLAARVRVPAELTTTSAWSSSRRTCAVTCRRHAP
jgi:hypothetical protein